MWVIIQLFFPLLPNTWVSYFWRKLWHNLIETEEIPIKIFFNMVYCNNVKQTL